MRDGELVRRSRTGSSDAFAELVRRYGRPAYTVALSVTGRHEDAQDAAQEAFITALQRIEECRDPDRFPGWFLTMVRNRSRNLMRRERVRIAEALPFNLPARDPGPDRHAARAVLRDELREAVVHLSEPQREVLLMHDLEGWKHREIAERLGMPSGTVRSHLHFARKRLKVLLGSGRWEGGGYIA